MHFKLLFFLIQEAKPYKNDPEILAMTNLVSAYQNNDINEFERILRTHRVNIMDDPFIKEHIEDLLRNIRTQVSLSLRSCNQSRCCHQPYKKSIIVESTWSVNN